MNTLKILQFNARGIQDKIKKILELSAQYAADILITEVKANNFYADPATVAQILGFELLMESQRAAVAVNKLPRSF